jgi:hypothetical protein
MACAACHESLRGRRAVAFDGKAVCLSPCGTLTKIKKVFSWGALETTGPELLRLFILEAARWSEKS